MKQALALLLFLVMLCSLFRCTPSTPDKSSHTVKVDSTAKASNMERQRKAGVDFIATGSGPSWTLEIDFGKEMRFYVAGGDTLRTPLPVPQSSDSTGEVVYETAMGNGKLRVSLQNKACSNSVTDTTWMYAVKVSINGKEYTGCGAYLFNAIQLHDIWAVEALNGKPLTPEGLRQGTPTLEINVLNQRFMGNTSCNEMSGQVIIESDRIRFLPPITTHMACPGKVEAIYVAALQRVNHYQRVEGKLMLLENTTELLRLRKID